LEGSSLVENLNSRRRNYFTLRRHPGGSYLDLLQFFLNHRCFMRSQRAERNGKNPRELMTGQGHPHWLGKWYRPISGGLVIDPSGIAANKAFSAPELPVSG
jgi:hypothetical protein